MILKSVQFLERKVQNSKLLNRMFVYFFQFFRIYEYAHICDRKITKFKNFLKRTKFNTIVCRRLSRYEQHSIPDVLLHSVFGLLSEYVSKNQNEVFLSDTKLKELSIEEQTKILKLRNLYFWWNFEYSEDTISLEEKIEKTKDAVELQLSCFDEQLHRN